MLSLLTLIIVFITKSVCYLTIFIVVFFVSLKLYVEPKKAAICKCTIKLNGKVVLITGGNSGIGLETARDLASRGAWVVIASRNTEKSQKAVNNIVEATGNTKVEYMPLDLSKFSSVKHFVKVFNEKFERLDILVNNAGAVGLKQRRTEDGVDMVQQINYLGPLLLTHLLLGKVIESKPSRIVNVSSYAHYITYFDPNDIKAMKSGLFPSIWFKYANSKLCQILWMKELAKRLPEGVTVNSLHPGIILTDLNHTVIKKYVAPAFFRVIIVKLMLLLFRNVKEGAQTTIHLCVAPELENSTGGYYHDCKLTEPAKKALDETLTEKVWKESLTTVGLEDLR